MTTTERRAGDLVAVLRCNSCHRPIGTRYSYTMLISSQLETLLGNFCAACWYELMPGPATRQLRSLLAVIRDDQPAP